MSDREASLYSTLVRVLFVAAGLGLSLWFAYEIGMILLVGVFSLIIAIAVNAPVEWLERRNVPRGLGTAITFLVLLGIGAVVGWLVVPQLFSEIPALIEGVPELIQDVADQAMALVGDSPEIRRQLSRVVDWSLTL
ncbi:MAG: AI-2E family transporter, partial [Rhodothermales bacterium]